MHTIYIKDLAVSATHGYYPIEKETPQSFLVSLSACVDDWSHDDMLEHTLNYELLRTLAINVLQTSPKNLLETLVDEMLVHILEIPKVISCTITLEKMKIFDDCVAGVSVTKQRTV